MKLKNLFVGWDQSINHCGIVVLDTDGNVFDVGFLATKVKDSQLPGGEMLPKSIRKLKNQQLKESNRLLWLRRYFVDWADKLNGYTKTHNVYVSIEDYAYNSPYRAHQIGEVGGLLKSVLLDYDKLHLRLHDPQSVKIFAAGRGDASKQEVAEGIQSTYGISFEQYGGAAEDLYDAYSLARMVLAEVEVRAGRLMLQDVPDDQRRIFLRTTKRYPVNLLDREWIGVV